MRDEHVHAAGALGAWLLLGLALWSAGAPAAEWIAAALVSLLFAAREAWQARADRARYPGRAWAMPWRWSRQKLAEAAWPMAAAIGGAGLVTVLR